MPQPTVSLNRVRELLTGHYAQGEVVETMHRTGSTEPAASAAPPDGTSGIILAPTGSKPSTGRHRERGGTRVDPRQTVLDILKRSGRAMQISEIRTAMVRWMRKPTTKGNQVFGYELTDGGLFREFPGQGEPPKVYPMITQRFGPNPGNDHRCVLVTLTSTRTDRAGNKVGEILVTYAMPVDPRPLFRSGEWNDNPMSVIEVENFQKSNRPGAYYFARGPNDKFVVIRDKSFVPPAGKVRVLVTEEISSFTALCLDEFHGKSGDNGVASGDLALASDAMQARLTDDPWFYVYDGHMYDVLAVLGGEINRQSTREELKAHFIALSRTENLAAKMRGFRQQWGITASKRDKDVFSKELGLIVACYKQTEQNFLRRDMEQKHKPTGSQLYQFVGVNLVRLTVLAEILQVDVEEIRNLLAKIGYPVNRTVQQVARPVAETVCGYYCAHNPDKTPTNPVVIQPPGATGHLALDLLTYDVLAHAAERGTKVCNERWMVLEYLGFMVEQRPEVFAAIATAARERGGKLLALVQEVEDVEGIVDPEAVGATEDPS